MHAPRSRRRALRLAAAIALAAGGSLLASSAAMAQAFPDRGLRLVVGFPPGTAPDVAARLIGQKLGELLKQSVTIENKPGAGGQIAAQTVAKSPADGYTLLLGELGSIAIAPPAFSKLPYDPAKELIGLAEVVRADFALAVPATSPHQSAADFVKAARAKSDKGDKINFATFGAGTPGHFGAEIFAEMAGFRVEPVHYRATGDAITSLVAGDTEGGFLSVALAAAQVKGGKLRALAVTSPARASALPEVPTFTEAGWPKADFSSWFAVFAPAGTPAVAADLLSRQLVAAVQSGEVKQKLTEAGLSVTGTSRADTEKMLKNEAQRWAQVVKATGFKGD